MVEGAAQEEVPYYIHNGDLESSIERKSYETKIIDEFIKEDQVYVDLKVTKVLDQVDQPITHLMVQLKNSYFATTMTIQGSYDGTHWETVNEGRGQEIFKVETHEQLTLYFDQAVKYTYFRLAMPKPLEPLEYEEILACYEEVLAEERYYNEQKSCEYEREEVANKTVITIDNSARLKFYELTLVLLGPFKRSYTLQGEQLDGSYDTLSEGMIYNSSLEGNSRGVSHLYFRNARGYEKLILTIDNLDDKPLEIEALEGSFGIDKVVFERKAGRTYILKYGDCTLEKPQYDIAAYSRQIEKEAQGIARLEEGQIVTEAQNQETAIRDYRNMYQVLVGLVSLLLIVMIIKSGKREK